MEHPIRAATTEPPGVRATHPILRPPGPTHQPQHYRPAHGSLTNSGGHPFITSSQRIPKPARPAFVETCTGRLRPSPWNKGQARQSIRPSRTPVDEEAHAHHQRPDSVPQPAAGHFRPAGQHVTAAHHAQPGPHHPQYPAEVQPDSGLKTLAEHAAAKPLDPHYTNDISDPFGLFQVPLSPRPQPSHGMGGKPGDRLLLDPTMASCHEVGHRQKRHAKIPEQGVLHTALSGMKESPWHSRIENQFNPSFTAGAPTGAFVGAPPDYSQIRMFNR